MRPLLDWFDRRTGYRGITQAMLYEHIPGGARWRYVWGSTLMFAFAVQMITGFFLWMNYSPSSQTAWESVYYIQHQMWGGAVLRGIHHFMAQTMIVLLALHLLQVIIDGAYRVPREINFWIGLVLLQLVLAISLTGYLLPWDQRGFWSTKVATSLMGIVPFIGPSLQRVVIGGADYGHHTLTRFFAVHAGLFPLMLMALIGVHVYVFRRHGLTHKEPRHRPDAYFWVDQVLRDSVACLGVLLVVLLLVFRFWIVPGGSDHIGAELSAPADPSRQFSAARPEWYFLFLFQFLKLPWFAGHNEVYGAIGVPAAVLVLFALMPITGRWRVGHAFNVFLTVLLSLGIVMLTTAAVLEDTGLPRLKLGAMGQWSATVTNGLVMAAIFGALLLIPLLARRGHFGFNMGVLAATCAIMLAACMIVLAGGGPVRGEGSLVTIAQQAIPLQRLLLLGLLLLLAILVTILLLNDRPPRGVVLRSAAAPLASPADAESVVSDRVVSWRRWQLQHRARLGVLLGVVAGAVFITAVALDPARGAGKASYQLAVAQARQDADRIVELAVAQGIGPQGAAVLLRDDPLTQGPPLFSRYCASCHRYDGHDGLGAQPVDPQSAPDLKGFATRAWIRGMLDPKQVDTVKYFGPKMKAHEGDMVKFVQSDLAEFESDQKKLLEPAIIALSAEAALPEQREMDRRDAEVIATGQAALANEDILCIDCHRYRTDRGGRRNVPTLTGYGSRKWLIEFIRNPAHPDFYGRANDRMPAYGEQGVLDDHSIAMLTDWLRRDWPGAPGAVVAAAAVPASRPTTSAPGRSPPPEKPTRSEASPAPSSGIRTSASQGETDRTSEPDTKPVPAVPDKDIPAPGLDEIPATSRPATTESSPATSPAATTRPAQPTTQVPEPSEPPAGSKTPN